MRTIAGSEKSLFGLIADLRDETKELIRQEVELAKSEISEKFSRFGHNAIWLTIGGFVAYAGLIVFLIGVAFLLSFFLGKLNWDPFLTHFVSAALVGLAAAGIGYALLAKALKSLSQESLAPQKTLHTIKELRGKDNGTLLRFRPAAARPSSTEMETLIGSTQRTVKETAAELREKLTPRYMARQFVVQARRHPLRSGLIAVVTSAAGFLLVKSRRRSRPVLSNRVGHLRIFGK